MNSGCELVLLMFEIMDFKGEEVKVCPEEIIAFHGTF